MIKICKSKKINVRNLFSCPNKGFYLFASLYSTTCKLKMNTLIMKTKRGGGISVNKENINKHIKVHTQNSFVGSKFGKTCII